MTGIDPGKQMIAVAKGHQQLDPSISRNLTYFHSNIDEFSQKNQANFDAAVASEVVEHVADLGDFLQRLSSVIKVIFILNFN